MIRRTESSTTTPLVEEVGQPRVGNVIETVGQTVEEIQTNQPILQQGSEIVSQHNGIEELGAALERMGIEGAVGGTGDEEAEPVEAEDRANEPFIMPLHGYSPYYYDPEEEPFDLTLISDKFEPAYEGAPWRHSYELYIGGKACGNYTFGGTIEFVAVRCPPQMIHDLIEIAKKYNGVIGNIYRDERGRESVEVLKMHQDGVKELCETTARHERIISEKQEKTEKKDAYSRRAKELRDQKGSTPSKKEAKKQAREAKKQEDNAYDTNKSSKDKKPKRPPRRRK